MLIDAGLTVIPYIRRNDDLRATKLREKWRVATQTTWSRTAFREIVQLIRQEQPDIAHFHNTFPQISPSAYAACNLHGVPVVQTLHNYRLVCAGAMLLRDGQPCEACIDGTQALGLWHGMRHRCYRGSLLATGALSLMLAVNRVNGSYSKNVSRYVALTKFAASRLQAGGLPVDRFVVKPNFLPSPPTAGSGKGGYAVYVGRLSAEKGVLTLLKAWKELSEIPLKVFGDGPLLDEMRKAVALDHLKVSFYGFRPRSEVLATVRDASIQIVPSECYEGFPMAILEALACGTPVVASGIGSLNEIITDGVDGEKFKVGDPMELAATVRRLLADSKALAKMRCSARESFDRHYTVERNIERTLEIYHDVLAERR